MMATIGRKFSTRQDTEIFLTLMAGILALALCLIPVSALASEKTETAGYIYAGEEGTFLEGEDGGLFMLKGEGLEGYSDKYVRVSGELSADEYGEPVIMVEDVEVLGETELLPGEGAEEENPEAL